MEPALAATLSEEHSCQAEWLQITPGCHGEIKVELMEVLQLSLCALCVCV